MIANIQMLRFWAAYAVAAFHFAGHYFYLDQIGWFGPALILFRHFGFVGVDIFFVVSGVIMWVSTQDSHNTDDIIPFLIKRFSRIFMSYLPWLALMALVRVYVLGQDIANYDLIRSIILIHTNGQMILPTGWTLSFELMFYLIFGVSMIFPRKIALTIIALWGVASLLIGQMEETILLNPYIAEFVAGVLLAASWPIASRIIGGVPFLTVLGLIFFSAGILFGDRNAPLSRVLTFGSFSLIAVWIAILFESRGFVVSKFWIFLGGASYALYLSHFVILTFGRHFWRWILADPDLAFFTMMAASLAVSCIWFKFYDGPLSRWVGRSVI